MSDEVREKVRTPIGELEWCAVRGKGKENLKGVLQYKASLVLDVKDDKNHKKFVKQAESFWEEHKGKMELKSLGIYDHKVPTGEVDDDGDKVYKATGKKVVVFKTNVEYPDRKKKVVRIFNAKNAEVDVADDFGIGNGSVGRLSGVMAFYKADKRNGGVTFYLDDVQLAKLVKYESDAGFDEIDHEEGDWSGDEDQNFDGDIEDEKPKKDKKGKKGKKRL